MKKQKKDNSHNYNERNMTPRTLRMRKRERELETENNNIKSKNKHQKKLKMNEEDVNSEDEMKPSAIVKPSENIKKNQELYYTDDSEDESSDDNITDKGKNNNTTIDSMKDDSGNQLRDDDSDSSSEENKQQKFTNNNNDTKGAFEKNLSNSDIIKAIFQNQKEIMEKLDLLTVQSASQQVITNGSILAICKLDSSQKSQISSYMRGKFKKLKFLRDEEWSQLGDKLFLDICNLLELKSEIEKKSYEKTIKSSAVGIINQRRAEIMRYVKIVAMGKFFFLVKTYQHLTNDFFQN
jgi:hypothetical protein